jgi:chemotaxis family two-component system sensor kinase Cph1
LIVLVRSTPARVAVTAALPALAFLISQLLRPWLEPAYDPPFLAAIGLTAWICGTGYGFAALTLSAIALDYFFLPPYDSFALLDASVYTKFLLFVGFGSVLIGLIRYIQDTSVALQESELRYRSLAELIPFGGWIADKRGNMIHVSESFLKTFGMTMEECRGLGWMRLLDESDRSQVLADWRECMRHGYFWDYEYRLRASDGGQRVVLSRGIQVQGLGGKARTWVGIHLDITERERSAEQRIEQARNIARFNAELEQFAYVSAHDLQEPLRMIASYLQLLSRRYKGKLDGDADTFIGYAVEGAERLQSLLRDLLELQQVGKYNKPKSLAPLATVVDRACANLSVMIAELDARITCAELPSVWCEEQAFIQLFVHLLDNGMKYRKEGVRPEIHISAEKVKSGMWEIRVQDNGIGIEPEFSEKIFDVFQRLHPRTMYPGTGIGLAICKKIVEVHGGHIRVESKPSEGSAFLFTVPAHRAPAA